MEIKIVASGGFNSGRLYSAAGQRIWWVQFNDGWLYFNDRDRMIEGWVERAGPEAVIAAPVLPEWLMRKYDRGEYEWYLKGDSARHYDPACRPPADFNYGDPIRV